MDAGRVKTNRTQRLGSANTRMYHLAVLVKPARSIRVNHGIDRCRWFAPDEARAHILQKNLAQTALRHFFSIRI